LINGGQSEKFNAGSGEGFSVKEIISTAEEIIGKKAEIKFEGRRRDPPVLLADSSKIKKELGWKPEYSDIKTIISTAYNWHKNNPKGYNKI
jgi:UDP-glucose 4-epimerase